jgi:hypothetical protein
MSCAEACVDQNHPSYCSLVTLHLADRLLAVELGLGNEELMACLHVLQGSSGPLHFAEMPGNQNSQFLKPDMKTRNNVRFRNYMQTRKYLITCIYAYRRQSAGTE